MRLFRKTFYVILSLTKLYKREMASVSQNENIFLVWSDDFFFFTWKFEETDLYSKEDIKSPNFSVEGREAFLRMEINYDLYDGDHYFYLYIPGSVSKRLIVTIVSDETNSVIYSNAVTRKCLGEIQVLKVYHILHGDTKYPIIITYISKNLEVLCKESLINSLDPAYLKSLMELSSDLKKALDQNMHSDVVLNIESDTIKAHKVILGARSPVFHKMFSNDSLESAENEVDIPDIRAETMKRFIRYMYTGTVEKCGFEENLELFYAADKYEVLSLRDICKTELLNLLQVDNACTLFALAARHCDEDLKERVVRFVRTDFKSVLDSESFDRLGMDDTKLLVRLCASAIKN